ncbi:hypothetical protein Egran_04920 [Elaphomyces granulatus]|uniref:Multicopper oxidase n=1 Tax=Elaphomyces granulatus TaxID=519963 RepID=A0A232LT41_9EURO|nr:hypothetical protein Egran_04920 [Elaphomyces granulatus]
MYLIDRFWISITYVLSCLTPSPFKGIGRVEQAPFLASSGSGPLHHHNGPIFKPPGGRLRGPGSEFTCEYPQMVGWSFCSTPENRACWLRNDETGAEYNITTDYEDINQTPIGITRNYVIDLTDDEINADGLAFPEGKIYNKTYPGPWIQACWGDTVTIIVKNHLAYNGTTVHWHGIRQWLSMNMDGVNGITQCPIAPGDSFNYTWKAMQYGSSWYHSHYSVQYADGAVGPMTLHGPSSAPYDEAKLPIVMTDWGHNSAFEAVQTSLEFPSIVLNGRGNITRYNNSMPAQLPVPTPYTITFERAKRYLLRLINTSFEATFVFSIDNHVLQIVGSDFVPIHPYFNKSVLIGIGQRYHVIVEADPINSTEENFWIRTWLANCFRFDQSQASPGYEQIGILRYGSSEAFPNTNPWEDVALSCSDETYTSLIPILPWTVGSPSNNQSSDVGQNFTVQGKSAPTFFPLAFFSLGGNHNPLRIDWENPTFLNLNNAGPWNPLWVVFPENYTSTDWIHLHGHDFAILQQIEGVKFPDQLNLKLDNPPRRDVVLLPTNGYVVIAFKTDNPGTWLVHCHIANHVALGLAVQIMERQQSAAALWPPGSPAINAATDVCSNWSKWWGNCNNWWPGDGSTCQFGSDNASPDSGV